MALIVQAATRGHLLQLFSPFVQILRVLWIVRGGTFGMHIFQITFTAHVLSTSAALAMFNTDALQNSVS
ncbi:MAG TPA: hypothetical protein DD635_00270 [Flavobacteriales bacterium]|nr:hypothetical protein [Flavobacteriales bacterium]